VNGSHAAPRQYTRPKTVDELEEELRHAAN
jgi:hypothetical protein